MTKRGLSASDRFWPKVQITERCWLWTAAKDDCGYGLFRLSRKRILRSHLFAYADQVGEIPEGMELDHLCRTTSCVNPSHLEPVSHRENTLRGTSWVAVNAAKTECPQGHPYDDENTRLYQGRRYCRACGNARRRIAKAKARAAR